MQFFFISCILTHKILNNQEPKPANTPAKGHKTLAMRAEHLKKIISSSLEIAHSDFDVWSGILIGHYSHAMFLFHIFIASTSSHYYASVCAIKGPITIKFLLPMYIITGCD